MSACDRCLSSVDATELFAFVAVLVVLMDVVTWERRREPVKLGTVCWMAAIQLPRFRGV
jgi:hypothetical protein